MTLVDTSVWIDHLRHNNSELVALLNSSQVLTHPFVIGEIAIGNLAARREVLSALRQLPVCLVATDEEVLNLIDARHLAGRGIGYIDAHLLAATLLTSNTTLWTFDKRLASFTA